MQTGRRLAWSIRKTLWFWLYIGEPTNFWTHWRKWLELDEAIRAWEADDQWPTRYLIETPATSSVGTWEQT